MRSPLAGETQAYVEALDMLEFTNVFFLWSEKIQESRDHRYQEFCTTRREVTHQPGIWLSEEEP